MAQRAKPVDALSVADLARHPIWEFVGNDDHLDETWVRPVKALPVSDLAGRIVAAELRLASGAVVCGTLGNVDPRDIRMTQHFMTVSVERDGGWFHLARYHDHDRNVRGPDALAAFLGLSTRDVFPIAYDIREIVAGDASVCVGTIDEEPAERLSRAQLIALAV